jgi:hypothetical protein
VSRDGAAFTVVFEAPVPEELVLFAVAPSGRSPTLPLDVVRVPSRVTVEEIRAFHVSFYGWADRRWRDQILEMAAEGRINAVQLDLKDESGMIGYDTDIPLAHEAGTAATIFRLREAVEELHERDLHVIARIVAFADPAFTEWAWANGERDTVVQDRDGNRYVGRYAGFTNFAHPDIVDYNIDIAEEAAAMGVDHILWDYVRKPDGPLEQFTFVGLESTPEDAIVEFVRLADERLAPYRVEHGASLYGISADRPTEVSQDVPALAEHLDYVAPMIYPSHWAPGEYGVADPLMQPGDMVAATLEKWLEATEGRRARVAPWLEDSNWPMRLGFPDRARYVREQIESTYAAGIDEWLLWDSSVRYTEEAMLQPDG